MVCKKCGSTELGGASYCQNCGNQLNVDLNDGKERYRLHLIRKKQFFPLISSFPYITPRLFINDELAYVFTKCEDLDFYFEKGIYKIDIVTMFGQSGEHIYIEIKENTEIEFHIAAKLGIVARIMFK